MKVLLFSRALVSGAVASSERRDAVLHTCVDRATASENGARRATFGVFEIRVGVAAARSVTNVDIPHRRVILPANLLQSIRQQLKVLILKEK